MSDLSRLLDDVYGDLGNASATPPAAPPSDAPDDDWGGGDDIFAAWADDHGARLDGDDGEPTAALDAVPDLGTATSAMSLSELGSGPAEVTEEVPAAGAPTWHRADDDILPQGRARAGRRRRSRGTAAASPAADAASIEDFAADGSALDALAGLEVPPPVAHDDTEATAPARRRGLRRR